MIRVGDLVQIGNGRARWIVTALLKDCDRAKLRIVSEPTGQTTTVAAVRLSTPHEIELLQRDAARSVLLDIQRLHRGRPTVSPYNPRNKETRCVECQKVHPCPSWMAVEQLKERSS